MTAKEKIDKLIDDRIKEDNKLLVMVKAIYPNAKYVYSEDIELYDDSIEVTDKISIQVGINYYSVTIEFEENNFAKGRFVSSAYDCIEELVKLTNKYL